VTPGSASAGGPPRDADRAGPADRAGLILQHARTGPPGRLGAWARERGIAHRVHRSWDASPADLDPADFGWIASLGSASSANANDPPWVREEVDLLRRAVAADVPVLGLCWGGQALSLALGGRVGPSPVHEKGWIAIASADPAIPGGPWLHYHTEVFTVPDGAVELARSPAGPAAFRFGPHLGVQFHPEADADMAHVWVAKDPEQTPDSIAALDAESARWSEPAATLAASLFDGWWESALRTPATRAPAAGGSARHS
jgi:GMP synthase-like glutamine amidotransferase